MTKKSIPATGGGSGRRRGAAAGWVLAALIAGGAAGAQTWVAQAPGPNTLGQVENIDEGEVAGAVNAVAVHPTNADVVYLGTVNGGIWKTVNATAPAPVWEPQTDGQRSLSIGALEIDPTDASGSTVVAGTGCFSSFGFCGAARAGLLRTTDGGGEWAAIEGQGGILNGMSIAGVAPRGSTIVIAVNDADSAARVGIWRSTDTGATWRRISGGAGTGLPAGAASDLGIDPVVPSRLFTHAGTAGIFRSTDTGATWTKVSSPAMDGQLAQAGNVRFAVGRSNNVYVAIVVVGQLRGVFRSGNGGGSWTAMELPRTIEKDGAVHGIHPGGQGAMHLSIAADLANPQVVYVGGDRQPCFSEPVCDPRIEPLFPNSIGAEDYSGRLFRGDASKPAGSQWVHLTHARGLGSPGGGTARSSAPHADSRDMAMAPNGDLIEADDGGLYRRTLPQSDAGDWFSMNGNLQATEFHAVAWDANTNLVIGAAQDTGAPEQRLRSDVRWRSVTTGDGGSIAVDDTGTPGQSTRYSSAQLLLDFRRQVYDTSNNFQSGDDVQMRIPGSSDLPVPQFYTPIRLNAVQPTRLILGADDGVYESFDQGHTVRLIRPRIRVNQTGPDIIAYGAAGNPDVLYVGSEARVFVRTAASPAPLVESAAYAGGEVLGLAIDPNQAATAYVADERRVFRTPDSGGSWQEITGNLTALSPGPLRTIAFNPDDPAGSVVVGGDGGVFQAPGPAFSSWSRLGTGLPGVPVYHLEYDAADRLLLAGTLGRGAWTLTFPSSVPAGGGAVPGIAPALTAFQPAGAGAAPAGEASGEAMIQLRPGVVIDRARTRAFIMNPAGGIDAVSLATGEKVWNTRAAAKPLGLVGPWLIAQGEAGGPANRLKIVVMSQATGSATKERTVALPPGVLPSIQSADGDFAVAALPAGEDAIVSWEFQREPVRGMPPGTQGRLSPPGGVPPPPPAAPGASTRRGAFRLDPETGATSAVNGAGPDVKPRPVLPVAEESLPGLPEPQVLSADGRHVQVSRRTADDRVWDKFTLTFYDRRTGQRVGELRSHFSHVPFLVTDSAVVFETPAFSRQTEAGLVTEPPKIRAVELETAREVWSQEVRDTAYRGPIPP